MTTNDLDQPVWGCEKIATIAGVVHEDGTPNTVRCYFMLQTKKIDASKIGTGRRSRWVSSRRRVLRSLGIEVAEAA
jgi:hypothetical protein